MLTYGLWLNMINDFTDMYTTVFGYMVCYSFCSLLTPLSVIFDIATLPFQLIGILIYFITKRRNK